jgi:hypothetical protein
VSGVVSAGCNAGLRRPLWWIYFRSAPTTKGCKLSLEKLQESRENAKRSDDELKFPRRNLELLGEYGFLAKEPIGR